ncbi:MAG: type IV toxin-antitoxin system AbiEi family antitoxin domain-containing protein [Streptosporangiaceae bacterium]
MSAGTELAQLLARQHFVVTRRQAVACGMHPNVVHRQVLPGGRWQRLLPGVFLTVTGTPAQDQREMAALLYAGRGATLTGLAVLRRHGLRVTSPDRSTS